MDRFFHHVKENWPNDWPEPQHWNVESFVEYDEFFRPMFRKYQGTFYLDKDMGLTSPVPGMYIISTTNLYTDVWDYDFVASIPPTTEGR